jgi:hypothetical protein
MNASRYLIDEKGIDAQRVELRAGTESGTRTATDVFVPEGATYPANGTISVDKTIDRSDGPQR